MYLTVRKIRGVAYLYLMKSIHVAGKRNPKKEIVKSYGRYDEAPEEVRQIYENRNSKKRLEENLADLENKNILDTAIKEVLKSESVPEGNQEAFSNFNRAFALHYGHLCLKNIWEQDLGFKYKIGYLQRTKTKIDSWSLNDLLFYLSSLKILDPSSYLKACSVKSNFLYCPWNNVTQDNFYRGLDFVYDHREDLLKFAVKKRLKDRKENIKVAFFDCTNTWFETPYDDITWQIIRFVRKIRSQLVEEGYDSNQIEEYLKGEEFQNLLAEELEIKKEDVIRMRGPSKEGRFTQPIVTVALAIDQTGFPIDCKVVAGNISEMKTIKPVLDSLKSKYAVTDVYFVADRGLNSAENLCTIRDAKLGFVVAQKVSRQKATQRKEMLDLSGYKNFTLEDDGTFHSINTENEVAPEMYRFKVCPHNKEKSVLINGEKTVLSIDCKIVYTYSPERKRRDLLSLENEISRAQKAIEGKELIGNPYGTGWRSLVQTEKEKATNKSDKDKFRAVGLKEKVIKDRREIAGYSALVFEHPDSNNGTELSPESVLSIYHQLVSIEDCFRVMKTNFSIRPVYVRLRERIIAHCYICVFALMMLRLLQEKIELMGHHFSAQKISQALAQALVLPIPSMGNGISTFMNVGLNPNFYSPSRANKKAQQGDPNETLDYKNICSAFEAERSANPSDTDLIIQAVGLRPLSLFSSLAEVKQRLGIANQPEDVMLSPDHVWYAQKLVKTLKSLPQPHTPGL